MRRAVSAADRSDLTRDLSSAAGGLRRVSRADRATCEGVQGQKAVYPGRRGLAGQGRESGFHSSCSRKLQGDLLEHAGHQAVATRAWTGAVARRWRDVVTSRERWRQT